MSREDRQKQRQDLLQQVQQLANQLKTFLMDFDEADAHSTTLQQVITSLDELFLLVIVGEFNSGKSALINALLRAPMLEEGVTPTTAKIIKIRYGVQPRQIQLDQNTLELLYPADFLQNISIVDTPGINAVLREHERLTEDFIPRSDLILLVISTDRSFTESERAFLERIRRWGKKVMIVLNKVDLLRTPQDLPRVSSFIEENCKKLLGFEPEIFPVSALQAQQSHTAIGHAAIRLWESSHIGSLEDYLFRKLDEGERARLKLSSPLGVMQRIIDETQRTVERRASLLTEDERTVRAIEGYLQQYRKEMQQNFSHRLSEIENIVLEMQQRGDRFFDETISVKRTFDLVQTKKIQREFEEKVGSNSASRIDGMVRELIDWLVDQEQKLWQQVMEYLDRRRKESSIREDQMIGSVSRQFDYNRHTLLQSVVKEVNRVVQSYDRQAEAQILAEDLQKAVVQSILVGAGGLGLGAVVVALATSAAIDVTGITAGLAVVALGLFIIPAQKAKAKRKFEEKMQELRQRLHALMNEQFNKELNGSIQRVNDALAPYIRFVHAEQEKLEGAHNRLTELNNEVLRLRSTVEQMD